MRWRRSTGRARSILFSTGAEAIENAVKIARAATGRSGIIAFTGAFMGAQRSPSAMTGKDAPYKKGFGPFPAEIYHVPFPVAGIGVTAEDALR